MLLRYREAPACFLLLGPVLPSSCDQLLLAPCLHTFSCGLFWDCGLGKYLRLCLSFTSHRGPLLLSEARKHPVFFHKKNKSYLTDPVMEKRNMSAVLYSHMSSVLFSHDISYGNSLHMLAVKLELSIKYGLFT